MKKLLLAIFFLSFLTIVPHSFAAGCTGTGNCYWVGGTGSSTNTTQWATTDGGAITGGLPSATDNCNFTSNSSTANAAYTFAIITSTLTCLDFVMDGPGAGNKVTWMGSTALTLSGSLNLSGGTTGITRTYTGTITFNNTSGTKTITSNGIVIGGPLIQNGNGGTLQIVDAFNTTSNLTFTAGTFDSTTNTTTVTLSGSAQSIFPTVQPTFYNLIRTPSVPAKTDTLTLAGNITISNLFTVSNGAIATNRVQVLSSTVGTPRTITAASISISNADFMDITGAGAASWDMSAVTGGSGDCGGNTMQALGTGAFTASTTLHYATSTSGSWSATSSWSTTTMGTPGARVPLCQDDVFMDATFGTSKTVTTDMPRLGANIDWTGATWTTGLTWNMSGVAVSLFGSLTMIDNLTISGAGFLYTFSGRGAYTFHPHALTWTGGFTLNAPTGSLTLQGDLTLPSNRSLTITGGEFSCVNGGNNYVLSVGSISVNNALATLTLGSGTHLVKNSGTVFGFTAGTLTPSTGTIKATDTTNTAITFTGGGKTYNNVYFSRGTSTATTTISGSNTFNNFKDDGTGTHELRFTNGTTQTISSWNVSGSPTNTIYINSATTATASLKLTGIQRACSDFLNIQHITATPNNKWYAGGNSINNQGITTAGTGWLFKKCSSNEITKGKVIIQRGKVTISP